MTPSRVYVAMQSRPRWNQKPNTGPHCTLGLVSVAVFQTKPTYHQAAMAQHNCIEQVQRSAVGVSIICQDDHCRSVCKNCGGASICPHTRGRSGLRGASICQHSARAAGRLHLRPLPTDDRGVNARTASAASLSWPLPARSPDLKLRVPIHTCTQCGQLRKGLQ